MVVNSLEIAKVQLRKPNRWRVKENGQTISSGFTNDLSRTGAWLRYGHHNVMLLLLNFKTSCRSSSLLETHNSIAAVELMKSIASKNYEPTTEYL